MPVLFTVVPSTSAVPGIQMSNAYCNGRKEEREREGGILGGMLLQSLLGH